MNDATSLGVPSRKLWLVAAVAGLIGLLGWVAPHGMRFPRPDVPSFDIQIRELWRIEVPEDVGGVGAAAAWPDGAIWIAASNSQAIWETDATGSSWRLAHEAQIVRDFGSRALAMVPSHGMLFLGRFGVSLFRTRSGPGIVIDETVRSTVHGFAGFQNGDYVVSYGQWRDDPHVEYAVHRYDSEGQHIASWHPAFSHSEWGDDEWRAVLRMSGGPIAVTRAAGLLVSDLVPFRITLYAGGFGDNSTVVIEDESILSSAEIRRALPRVGTYSPGGWSRSTFVGEMSNGSILNVVFVAERSLFGRSGHAQWVVVSAGGEVLVQEKTEYLVVAELGSDTYLATAVDGDLVKLAVTVEDISP